MSLILGTAATCFDSVALADSAKAAGDVDAIAAVRDYVRQTREWLEAEYSIEFKGRTGDVLDFWILHEDDEPIPGGGRSFAVELNAQTLAVLRELHFQ